MPPDALNGAIQLPASLLPIDPCLLLLLPRPSQKIPQSLFPLLFPGSSFYVLASVHIY